MKPNDQDFRVIPYFCSALAGEEKRPTYETVLRGMARKLSYLPDLSIATVARQFHGRAMKGLQESLSPGSWRDDLLFELLKGEPRVILFLDGLDECNSVSDIQEVLQLMKDILEKFPQVYLLCSSQQHVEVDKYFSGQSVYEVNVQQQDTMEDMKNFIENEIRFRKTDVSLSECIFCM
jgi:hypothetical protein